MRQESPGETGSLARLQHLPQLQSYALGRAYDEMFDPRGVTREHYAALYERLGAVDPQELRQRQTAADLAFLNQGITFTVYGQNEGTERIFPYDLIPRILTAGEWDTIERGLTQRITALNLFLKDLYGEAKVLDDGIVPRELVYSCKHFRREMQGVAVRHDIYVSVAGTDLVRLPDGSFAVLEDNLRVPSGVSYMLTNRQVIKRIFPLLFSSYDVRPVDHYGPTAASTTTSSTRWRSAPIRRSACRGSSTPTARATWRSRTPSARAWPTTRRSTSTCRASSSTTSTRIRSSPTSRRGRCRTTASASTCSTASTKWS
jgi:hypothetical protein